MGGEDIGDLLRQVLARLDVIDSQLGAIGGKLLDHNDSLESLASIGKRITEDPVTLVRERAYQAKDPRVRDHLLGVAEQMRRL